MSRARLYYRHELPERDEVLCREIAVLWREVPGTGHHVWRLHSRVTRSGPRALCARLVSSLHDALRRHVNVMTPGELRFCIKTYLDNSAPLRQTQSGRAILRSYRTEEALV
jgi:hypothetical protein